jgi:hypothetical protein
MTRPANVVRARFEYLAWRNQLELTRSRCRRGSGGSGAELLQRLTFSVVGMSLE